MEISCTECGKQHNIPDTAIDNKKIFFYCNSCGHKIIVDNRKNFVKQPGSRKELPVIADILSGIPLAFNFNSILLSCVYAILFLMTALLFSIIFGKNLQNLIKNPVPLIISGVIFFGIFYFLFLILLYYISKIAYFRMLNPGYKRLDWNFINFDVKEDSVVLFTIYIFSLVIFSVLTLPVIYLSKGGVIYTGILFPVFYIIAFIVTFSLIFINYIPAIIASKSQYISDSFSEIISFFRTEFLNIPVYTIIINILSAIVYAIVNFFITLPLVFTGGILLILLGGDSKTALMGFFSRIAAKYTGAADQFPAVSSDVTLGAIFIIIFLLVFFVFLWSLMISISQTLYTKAVFIMQKNPEHSINRNIYLAALIVIVILLGIFSSVVLKISGITAITDFLK
ncbi:MAG: hypothetical protein JW982_08760 [Spirochaetes bacterium]|nr:hypothetical protein [Spirochaetota bacterium]